MHSTKRDLENVEANQTNIINPPLRWSTIRENWPIIVTLVVMVVGGFSMYHEFRNLKNDMSNAKRELIEIQNTLRSDVVPKHIFKELDDKVTRQYSTHSTSQERMRGEIDAIKAWKEQRTGYEQAIKDLRK